MNARPEKDLRRRADIVFRRARVAVFIDGCYWHGCPDHFVEPKTNADYWLPKIRRNMERDAETSRLLAERGWTVFRFWEHEDPAEVADRVRSAVKSPADGMNVAGTT